MQIHSGMFTVADVDYGRKCNLTCIRVSKVEDIQGQRAQTDSEWICKIDEDKWVDERFVSPVSCVTAFEERAAISDEQPVSTDSGGPAYVYVFRPGNDGHPALDLPLMFTRTGRDRTLLAVIDDGRFIKVELESGEYLFFSDHQSAPAVKLSIRAGREYYLEMDSSWLGKDNGGKLLLATEGEALKKIENLKPLDEKFVSDPRVVVP